MGNGNPQQIIIGSGAITALVLLTNNVMTQKPIAKPLIGVFIATILLAALDAAGMGQIAAPMAMLVAIGVVSAYGVNILTELEKI